MKEIYKDYLFEKHILVSDGETEEKHVFETLFAMAHFFGVKITKGIFVQARYGLGLTEVSTNAKAKNSVVQVSAGFMF